MNCEGGRCALAPATTGEIKVKTHEIRTIFLSASLTLPRHLFNFRWRLFTSKNSKSRMLALDSLCHCAFFWQCQGQIWVARENADLMAQSDNAQDFFILFFCCCHFFIEKNYQ